MEAKSTPENQTEPSLCPSDQFFRDLNIEFLIHELKDPLSVIETGLLMLLEKQQLSGPLTERQQKTLQRLLRSSRKVRGMVYELLEVGRAEADCIISSPFLPQPVLQEVLWEVIEAQDIYLLEQISQIEDHSAKLVLLAKNKIDLTVDPDTRQIEIIQDKTKFAQITANLLKNAFHYRHHAVKIHLGQHNDQIRLSVTDDGPGIDPIYHEAVFERYKQVAPEGMERRGHGLGLAMARILARSMGGDIAIESEPGQGATFRFQLPKKLP